LEDFLKDFPNQQALAGSPAPLDLLTFSSREARLSLQLLLVISLGWIVF
jgi:hypothetical protein